MSKTVLMPILCFVIAVLSRHDAALAQPEVVDIQYRRKAEMLYPLAKLIQPEQGLAAGSDTVVVGVLGPDPFQGIDAEGRETNYLDEQVQFSNANRSKTGRKQLVVKRFSTSKDYKPCHILYVSSREAAAGEERTVDVRLRSVLERTAGSVLLIVADTEGLAAKGAVINFFLMRDPQGVPKVALEFNPDAARRSGLTKVDAGIYRLAKIARDQ